MIKFTTRATGMCEWTVTTDDGAKCTVVTLLHDALRWVIGSAGVSAVFTFQSYAQDIMLQAGMLCSRSQL